MRVAFYAPLKSPNHPVPSGDRLMARLLIRALELAGHSVEIVSAFRSFAATPEEVTRRLSAAQVELQRLRNDWSSKQRPDLWFCYHPYYKSPDPFGPTLCREFVIPYVTAEASYSAKRDATEWALPQRLVVDGARDAAVNIVLTERDRAGLIEALPAGSFAALKPFIDTALFDTVLPQAEPQRLIAVAMMRGGDKMQSYTMLAEALGLLRDRPWTLAIAGDGPMRADVERLLGVFEPDRIEWLGELSAGQIADELSHSGIYVWPGCGEAYGLAYLEAQAAGLPVIAQRTAGVPEVVTDGITGNLTPRGDVPAFAAAIAALLDDPVRRSTMGTSARHFVLKERSLKVAATALDTILRTYVRREV
ncbi:Glycosyltransferase involved in cell wall bisynthesis [Rhizobium tibeticum]|uniref:GDP-mannose-dependent alpha-(1-6)-phosphatidylinositol monomannoside mannosyltransferase n=1 Tax=Rhizobium tibeticum TaxID=501024 RepID=A0A1H8IPD6_9HYPH|nr:glycosyltransferase family 4 protein [Rhizobium tibeticum]SEH72255.1 GDP-mannose-dependent alpha-(1-6)-phosphatidylinositol monomannoside mannosyltransferase [Rhizobium tibeticum]SEN70279.1 Glycosyltransferase involved in cell wall bisynthesis [Rhizobium tibeticum]